MGLGFRGSGFGAGRAQGLGVRCWAGALPYLAQMRRHVFVREGGPKRCKRSPWTLSPCKARKREREGERERQRQRQREIERDPHPRLRHWSHACRWKWGARVFMFCNMCQAALQIMQGFGLQHLRLGQPICKGYTTPYRNFVDYLLKESYRLPLKRTL